MAQSSASNVSSKALLVCHDVSFSYYNNSILSRITFDIEPGQFVGLVGANGAGKSTLLRCLYRYLTPQSGFVTFEHKQIQNIPSKLFAQEVAVVVQEPPNNFNLRVFDVVALGLTPYLSAFSLLSSQQKDKVKQAIAQVGLQEKCEQGFEQLSGGEKQRVLIAKAIVQQPKLLIMDEPTSHLDIKYQIEIMRLAKSLNIAVIASFHDLNLAAAMSDKLLMLHRGNLVAIGTPNEVVTQENIEAFFDTKVEVTTRDHADIPQVFYDYGAS